MKRCHEKFQSGSRSKWNKLHQKFVHFLNTIARERDQKKKNLQISLRIHINKLLCIVHGNDLFLVLYIIISQE